MRKEKDKRRQVGQEREQVRGKFSNKREEMAVAGIGEGPGRDQVKPCGYLSQFPMLTCAGGEGGTWRVTPMPVMSWTTSFS